MINNNPLRCLDYLIQKQSLVCRRYLPPDQFAQFCRDHGIHVMPTDLERLEQLGILYPAARIYYPLLPRRVEDPAGRDDLEIEGKFLQPGDVWDGPTIEDRPYMQPEHELALAWLQEGLIWHPSAKPFQPWNTFIDDDGKQNTQSFYSEFQCYTLYRIDRAGYLKKEIRLDWWMSLSEEERKTTIERFMEHAEEELHLCREFAAQWDTLAGICQVLSSRYYFHTQTDRRQTRVSEPLGWSWSEVRRTWNAQEVRSELGLAADDVVDLIRDISGEAQFTDPLDQWHPIVRFVSVDKRRQLKGAALLGQFLWEIVDMLKLFYRDVTGEVLGNPHEWPALMEERYGEGILDDELRYLEQLATEYHLNPREKLILMVEGKGEEEQLPRLAKEFFGLPFSLLGVRVVKMRSYTEVVGTKQESKLGGPLRRFIDDNHHRNTLVYVIVDNDDNRLADARNKLIDTDSSYGCSRKITRPEYVRLWEINVEFDNFSSEEIAHAMTEASQGTYRFSELEVEACRQEAYQQLRFSAGKRVDTLSRLFESKVPTRHLDKPALLENLFGFIIKNREREFGPDGEPLRPVVARVREVLRLAAGNHLPVGHKIWQRNQTSGYFGTMSGRRSEPDSDTAGSATALDPDIDA